jgi:antitoxin component YwqK of YwqJK toxin-antitoxin module
METKIERKYWKSGKLQSETPYVNGTLHGVWKLWWENGQQESEQPYVDGKLHGMEKSWWQDGDIYYFWLWNQDELVATFYPRNETQRWKLK